MDLGFRKYFPFLLHIFICFPTLGTSQPDFIGYSCIQSGGNYTNNSLYRTNLDTLLTSLPSGIDDYGFNSSSFGDTTDTVHAISLCRGDVEIDACRDCVRNATSKLTKTCPNNREAIGRYDYCMLRYSTESIYGKLESNPTFYLRNSFNVSSKEQFNQALWTLFSGLRNNASSGGDHKKFATGSIIGPDVLTIYGLMQCTPDLSKQDCDSCLSGVTNGISDFCSGQKGCQVITPSCSFRYEIYQFYNETPSAAPPPDASAGTY